MPLTSFNRRAQKELRSLFEDGWVILYTLQVGNVKYAAVRHPVKGGIIGLREEGRSYYLSKGGEIIKFARW